MTDVTAEFAPEGVLRVALNFGNQILVGRNAEGQPVGISVDIARALATQLALDLVFVEYARAVDVSGSATSGDWDVCFLAVDPARAQTLAFTQPYVGIEGSYLAAPQCDVADAPALVAAGLPVGTVSGSAYSLMLQRMPGHEHLVIFDTIADALLALDRGDVAAMAGIGAVMQREADKRAGARVLEPPFMQIRQAMAMPVGRPAAHQALVAFLKDLTDTGAIGAILEAHGVDRNCALAARCGPGAGHSPVTPT